MKGAPGRRRRDVRTGKPHAHVICHMSHMTDDAIGPWRRPHRPGSDPRIGDLMDTLTVSVITSIWIKAPSTRALTALDRR